MVPRSERSTEFSSLRIGLSQPQGGKSYEFFILGKNDKALTLELHKVFAKHKTSMIIQHGYVDDTSNQLVLDYCCDLTKSDCSPDELLLELRRISHVTRVDKRLMKNSLYENLLSPLTVIDRFRSVVMGIDPLLRIEKHLNDLIGVQGTSLMYDEGRFYAIDLVKQHREAIISHVSADSETVLQNILAGFKVCGWGSFEVKLEGEMANAIITDLPPGINSEIGDTSGCTFVYGMIAGVIEGLYGFDMNVRNVSYDKNGNVLRLVYTPRETQEESSALISNQETSTTALLMQSTGQISDSQEYGLESNLTQKELTSEIETPPKEPSSEQCIEKMNSDLSPAIEETKMSETSNTTPQESSPTEPPKPVIAFKYTRSKAEDKKKGDSVKEAESKEPVTKAKAEESSGQVEPKKSNKEKPKSVGRKDPEQDSKEYKSEPSASLNKAEPESDEAAFSTDEFLDGMNDEGDLF